jgi:hypothetical protein
LRTTSDRLTLTAKKREKKVDVTFRGQTKQLSVTAALKMMDTLTHSGADVAEKER